MSDSAGFAVDLARVGISAKDPWDLVSTRRPYPAAIPVLLDWLDRVDREVLPDDREKFREGLVRSLAVKEARGIAAPSLIREFRRSNTGPGYRWAVGNALEVVADDAVRRDMIELARDRSFGRDRQMIVLGLSRMRDSEVADVLLELLTDDGVAGHAVKALGRLKVPRARPAIERLVDHATPWVRAEARKALAKLSA